MKQMFWLSAFLTCILLNGLLSGCQSPKQANGNTFDVPKEDIYIFEDIKGPNTHSTVPKRKKTDWRDYSHGSPSRLAILLTDEGSHWLGLAHGLKSIGVPFVITTDYEQALQHHVVMVYPLISGRALKAGALKALAAFPKEGGTLIGCNVLGGGLSETFGFKDIIPDRTHKSIQFQASSELTKTFTDPKEKTIRFDKGQETLAYSQPKNPPIAVYEDGAAAITQKAFVTGHAYAVGFDFGQYILKGHNARQERIARTYDNAYEPSVDVLLRLLKTIYTSNEANAVSIGTVPNGKDVSVMMTHDIDFTKSIKNAVDYALYEKSQNIPATYFIQTKYIKDFNDDIFFNATGVGYLKQIHDMGMEIGSHSISHSKVFDRFPMGTGDEQYPTYTPFVKESFVTYNGSILGELRVSKFLLESVLPKYDVISFRPGELSYPFQLPEALLATGFPFSSATTANNSLTHLPYQLNYSREIDSELESFEFPVTIEDEALPKLGDRVPQALALTQKLRQYGGSVVILIHPNILEHKLSFEKNYVEAVKPYAWFGSIRDFGYWWAARNSIEIDISDSNNKKQMTIKAPKKINGVTAMIPTKWRLTAPKDGSVTQSGNKLLFKELAGTTELSFQVK